MNAASISPTSLPVRQGEVIAGKFRIERLIAQGGDGVVMLATHLQLDERVALKFLTSDNPESALAEARLCLRLKTPHVARVLDVGRHGDRHFIVMEHLEGTDLQQLLVESGRLDDVAQAVELVVQVCEAVAEAHRAGIIHRDIKLANIFLVASRSAVPQVKLLDFGIASDGAAPAQRAAGTLQYMAPEALQGVSDDPRSDLWAIGVVLYELLSGAKPFAGTDAVRLIADIYEAEHPGLRSLRPDVPEALEAVIDRCLDKEPSFRFQTAGELADALRPFAPTRAHGAIDRSLELSAEGPPSVRSLGPPSSRSIPVAAKSSGSLRAVDGLRASGSRRASPTTRRGVTLAVDSAGEKPSRRWIAYVVAAVAVAALGATLVVVRTMDANKSAPSASSPADTATAEVAATAATPAEPGAASAPPPSEPASATAAETASAIGARPAATPVALPTAVPVYRPPTSRSALASAAAATPSTSAPTSPPTSASARPSAVDKDPWRANKPKLEDNPFK